MTKNPFMEKQRASEIRAGRPARKPASEISTGRPTRDNGVACPSCSRRDGTAVRDSRITDEGALVRRRRRCFNCDHSWTTYEVPAEVLADLEKEAASAEPVNAIQFALGAFVETLRQHGYEVKRVGIPSAPKTGDEDVG